MRLPRKILVPTDLSLFSLEALIYAEEISKLFNGEIIVFHALSRQGTTKGQVEVEFEARKAFIHLLMELNIVPQNLRLEIGIGMPVEGILAASLQCRADIIVMTTHGRTGISQALVGSVAEQVVRLSPIPVLTLKPEGINDPSVVREEDVRSNLHLN